MVTRSIYELTHDVGRNSRLKLEDRDRLPSKVVQDMDLAMSSSSKFCVVQALTHLVIPATDGYVSASGVPGDTADPESWVIRRTERTLQRAC